MKEGLHPRGLEVKCGATNLKGIQWNADLTQELNC